MPLKITIKPVSKAQAKKEIASATKGGRRPLTMKELEKTPEDQAQDKALLKKLNRPKGK